MSTIRVVFFPNPDGSRRDPGFPATDQHPSASRYPFDHQTHGLLNVDAIGGAPTLAEIDAHIGPRSIGGAESITTRQRAQGIEELGRRMSLGAPQEEINRQLLDLLKG